MRKVGGMRQNRRMDDPPSRGRFGGLAAVRSSRRERNAPFYQTNPPFFGVFFVVSNYE